MTLKPVKNVKKTFADAVSALLQTTAIGRPLIWLATTPSTNAQLAKMSAQGAANGTVLVAETQTAGRGRMARAWHSPPGLGLYFSILLKPEVAISEVTTLPLVVGLAVVEAIIPYLPNCRPLLKWPNDILIANRKPCGILCEMTSSAGNTPNLIVGIGLNVNAAPDDFPPDIAKRATSLRICAGHRIPREQLLADILFGLEKGFKKWQINGFTPFLPRLHQLDALYGREITVERAAGAVISGVASGICEDGSLHLTLPDGSFEKVYSGDAHIGHNFRC